MSTITRGNISKMLEAGINKVFGNSYTYNIGEHKDLFTVEKSSKKEEEEVQMTGFGLATKKAEGGSVEYDTAQEGYTVKYIHETIANGFKITEEAVEDNLYPKIALRNAKALGGSMAHTKEIKAANFYNNMFDDVWADGVSLINASHPTVGGDTQSNREDADLSEAALENMIIQISQMKDDRGLLMAAQARKLIIPSQLLFTARKILESDMSTSATVGGSGDLNSNQKNIIKNGFFPEGVCVNHRLTDTDAWFIKTDVANGPKMFQRTGLQYKSEGDFDTGNYKFKARERFSFGASDWRSIFGSKGA